MTDFTETRPESLDRALWPAALLRWLDGCGRRESSSQHEARPATAEPRTRAGKEPRP